MLKDLFPKNHTRYSSLPLLGSVVEGFAESLMNQRYRPSSIRGRVRALKRIDLKLRHLGCKNPEMLTEELLQRCAPPPGRCHDDVEISTTVRLLKLYLELLPLEVPLSPINQKLSEFSDFLQNVRGLSASTIENHVSTARRFIEALRNQGRGLSHLSRLNQDDIESFVQHVGREVDRGRLQHIVAQLRSFLRFLSSRAEVPLGLDSQIDTPRMYRGEKLPRSLEWDMIRKLLDSIDRSTSMGKRDYAMMLLIATYGLRSSEVAGLKFDDIQWRTNRLRVFQPKTTSPLILPLVDEVGKAILDYLQSGRPAVPCRQVFVRHKIPIGNLERTGVTDAFQSCVRKSGLPIPFQGPHCLRHSYAVYLLRQGTSIKVIGDVLGHRSFESTCVYLRLGIEDLRAVPLSLPTPSNNTEAGHE